MDREPGNGREPAASKEADEPTGPGEDPRLKVVDRRWWARGESDPAPETGWEPRKPTYVEELERQLADKDQLLQKYISQYKEAAGEFDDAKARIRRDIAKDIATSRQLSMGELIEQENRSRVRGNLSSCIRRLVLQELRDRIRLADAELLRLKAH